ncbi:MAG: hypothetical protein QOE70_4851 [Chthoniobacter sp.]|jgi:dipeptidyl aminopeptidase/acylaminoacyl peptidase|nr:hypothetical protein [Chthoniobacter sp.]
MKFRQPRVSLFVALALISTAAAGEPVSFRKEIAPLLHRRCASCHSEDNAKGGYRLDSFTHLLQKGDSDLAPIAPGKAGDSELYRLLLESSPEDRMPQKADPLPAGELALIARWINEGAAYDGGKAERPLVELARETLLRPAPEHYARPAPVTALAFSPDGTQLAVSGYYEVTFWNAETGALVRRVGGMPERITALAWHPKRNLIAVAGGSPSQWGAVLLIDPAAGFQARVLCDLPETALSVAFSPDGKLLLASAGDRTIRQFDLPGGKQKRLWRQHADWVQSVAFSRDGSRFVSASRDRTARVFDLASGEVRATYADHEAPLLAAAFTGSSSVVSASRGQPLHFWDADSGSKKGEFVEAAREVQVLLPSGFGLLTGGTDHLVRVQQLSDRRELFALQGHHDVVESLALDPRGTVFASGAHDGEICIWSLACGTWLRRFVSSP